jgi:hypothetical protein
MPGKEDCLTPAHITGKSSAERKRMRRVKTGQIGHSLVRSPYELCVLCGESLKSGKNGNGEKEKCCVT